MKIKNLIITDVESSGHGSANYQNKKIFVLGVFPGDKVDVFIYKTIKNIHYAEIENIIFYSPLRKNQIFKFPANIPWENLSREGEYFLKNQILKKIYPTIKILEKIKENKQIELYNYRNKLAYAFKENKQGNLDFALYTRGLSEKKKESQKTNKLTHPQIEKIGKIFLDFFNKKNVQKEDIKYLILRYSYVNNSTVAHILIPQENRKKIPFKKQDLEKIKEKYTELKGILVSYSPPSIRSAQTYKDFYSIGEIDIEERVLKKRYLYHPSLFFQIYPKAFEEILVDMRKIFEKIPKIKEYKLLDLFAGVGIVGLEFADLVKEVLGVELSSLSKKYAEKNSIKNAITNFKFIESSADTVLDYIKEEQILIVDPPRSGLSKILINTIFYKKPKYIFYISCNPETQKRDFEKIKNNYKVIFLKGYNLFPKTHHIETLLVLEKK